MKTSFAYTWFFFLPSCSIDEVACLSAETNFPIFASHSFPIHLLGKVDHPLFLLYIQHLSRMQAFSLAFNYTRSSQGSKSFPQNSLHHFCFSLPFIFFKDCSHSASTLPYLLLTGQTNLIASLSQLSLKLPVIPILLKSVVTFLSPPPEYLRGTANSTCPKLKPGSSPPSLSLFA